MPEEKKIDAKATLESALRKAVRERVKKVPKHGKDPEAGTDAAMARLISFVESARRGLFPRRNVARGLKMLRDEGGVQDEDLDALIREMEGRE